jgi:hypothetical protein
MNVTFNPKYQAAWVGSTQAAGKSSVTAVNDSNKPKENFQNSELIQSLEKDIATIQESKEIFLTKEILNIIRVNESQGIDPSTSITTGLSEEQKKILVKRYKLNVSQENAAQIYNLINNDSSLASGTGYGETNLGPFSKKIKVDIEYLEALRNIMRKLKEDSNSLKDPEIKHWLNESGVIPEILNLQNAVIDKKEFAGTEMDARLGEVRREAESFFQLAGSDHGRNPKITMGIPTVNSVNTETIDSAKLLLFSANTDSQYITATKTFIDNIIKDGHSLRSLNDDSFYMNIAGQINQDSMVASVIAQNLKQRAQDMAYKPLSDKDLEFLKKEGLYSQYQELQKVLQNEVIKAMEQQNISLSQQITQARTEGLNSESERFINNYANLQISSLKELKNAQNTDDFNTAMQNYLNNILLRTNKEMELNGRIEKLLELKQTLDKNPNNADLSLNIPNSLLSDQQKKAYAKHLIASLRDEIDSSTLGTTNFNQINHLRISDRLETELKNTDPLTNSHPLLRKENDSYIISGIYNNNSISLEISEADYTKLLNSLDKPAKKKLDGDSDFDPSYNQTNIRFIPINSDGSKSPESSVSLKDLTRVIQQRIYNEDITNFNQKRSEQANLNNQITALETSLNARSPAPNLIQEVNAFLEKFGDSININHNAGNAVLHSSLSDRDRALFSIQALRNQVEQDNKTTTKQQELLFGTKNRDGKIMAIGLVPQIDNRMAIAVSDQHEVGLNLPAYSTSSRLAAPLELFMNSVKDYLGEPNNLKNLKNGVIQETVDKHFNLSKDTQYILLEEESRHLDKLNKLWTGADYQSFRSLENQVAAQSALLKESQVQKLKEQNKDYGLNNDDLELYKKPVFNMNPEEKVWREKINAVLYRIIDNRLNSRYPNSEAEKQDMDKYQALRSLYVTKQDETAAVKTREESLEKEKKMSSEQRLGVLTSKNNDGRYSSLIDNVANLIKDFTLRLAYSLNIDLDNFSDEIKKNQKQSPQNNEFHYFVWNNMNNTL